MTMFYQYGFLSMIANNIQRKYFEQQTTTANLSTKPYSFYIDLHSTRYLGKELCSAWTILHLVLLRLSRQEVSKQASIRIERCLETTDSTLSIVPDCHSSIAADFAQTHSCTCLL